MGFEPTEPAYAAQRISSPPDSTALASLRAPAAQARLPGIPGLRAQEDSNLRPLDPQSNALSRLSYGHESVRHSVAPSERVGFEPTVPLRIQLLSREPDSTTLAPLPAVHARAEAARTGSMGGTDSMGTGHPSTRRGRDSNPRSHTLNGFQDRLLRPLGHLSEACTLPRIPIYRRPAPGCQIPAPGLRDFPGLREVSIPPRLLSGRRGRLSVPLTVPVVPFHGLGDSGRAGGDRHRPVGHRGQTPRRAGPRPARRHDARPLAARIRSREGSQ